MPSPGGLESQNYSALAYELASANLKRSMEEPTNEIYRMNMLIAANFSGRAIEITKTNICHAISYPLTELYGIPHGIACAMSVVYFAHKQGIELDFWFLQFKLPKYKIDKEKVADIVMQNEKILSYRNQVTRDDIIASLS
jgi:alcohol dehydrogenase YqhD (iron-dependent ADH family)